MAVNIYDIAKLAGVSIATVSRVVNGSPKVSEKTKQKVLAVMKEYDYTPNVFARGLGLDSMKTVGILCPNIADNYMARAVAYLESSFHEHGYNCILGCSGFEQDEKEKYVNMLLSKRIDALVLVGSTYAGTGRDEYDTDYIREAAAQVPVFLINGRVSGENVYCICADDYHATYEVTRALIRRGRKKILFLYDSDSFSGKMKRKGYEAALIDADYPVIGQLKFRSKNDIEYTKNMLLEYNRTLDFDSVVATDDMMAVGALKYAKVQKMKVPEDLSVIGYNDSLVAVSCEPELTSVDSKLDVLCRTTVEHMIDLLENQKQIEQNKVVPCEIVKRCTSDF
ncbi:LacI family DNA-binding transcriptional regulator [uncultured Eubacterium sp.]|uniref:LacI family DNA-binding transcriptional regulator n=1 Tax=uncultured Eubacterium sp. TaxID=165185 RepID=UPI002591BF87|nr:LacI family DNA-binding transcriptional regulator [uncultured Eubacterium sp.]